jgi:hypothetical protein
VSVDGQRLTLKSRHVTRTMMFDATGACFAMCCPL